MHDCNIPLVSDLYLLPVHPPLVSIFSVQTQEHTHLHTSHFDLWPPGYILTQSAGSVSLPHHQ